MTYGLSSNQPKTGPPVSRGLEFGLVLQLDTGAVIVVVVDREPVTPEGRSALATAPG